MISVSVPAYGRQRLARVLAVPLIGLPGAGKSSVAGYLVARLQVRHVCRDAIRAALFPDCNYSEAEKRAAFKALIVALEVNCALGESSVLDGMTLGRARDRDRVCDVARGLGAVAVPIWLDVPPHVAKDRIAAQPSHTAADRSPGLVERVLETFEAPPPSVAAIDATLPLAQVCEQVLAIVLAHAKSTTP